MSYIGNFSGIGPRGYLYTGPLVLPQPDAPEPKERVVKGLNERWTIDVYGEMTDEQVLQAVHKSIRECQD